MNPPNAIEEVNTLAEKLYAIGRWQEDQIRGTTETGELLISASKWLKKLTRDMCGQGFVGCTGGAKCTSDHK